MSKTPTCLIAKDYEERYYRILTNKIIKFTYEAELEALDKLMQIRDEQLDKDPAFPSNYNEVSA